MSAKTFDCLEEIWPGSWACHGAMLGSFDIGSVLGIGPIGSVKAIEEFGNCSQNNPLPCRQAFIICITESTLGW